MLGKSDCDKLTSPCSQSQLSLRNSCPLYKAATDTIGYLYSVGCVTLGSNIDASSILPA